MCTVEVGAHKTVEKAVIPVCKLLLEGVRCSSEPIDKALPYLLNLGVRHLYGVSIPHFDGLGLACYGIPHLLALVDVGNGIVQGVLQKVDAIITAELALYGVLVPNIGVLLVA